MTQKPRKEWTLNSQGSAWEAETPPPETILTKLRKKMKGKTSK